MRPRSLLITTLMILGAFALGLTLGGELPRTVSAQDDPDEIAWHYSKGGKLSIFNQTDDEAFLIRGTYNEDAGVEEPPAESPGVFTTYVTADEAIIVYKLKAELMCDPRECRRCNGEVCPSPPWPPVWTTGSFSTHVPPG